MFAQHYIFSTVRFHFFKKSCQILTFLHQNDRSVKDHRPMGCATMAAAPENGGNLRDFQSALIFIIPTQKLLKKSEELMLDVCDLKIDLL